MKRIIMIAACSILFQLNGTAQVNKNAIGIRISPGAGLRNATFSYQLGLGSNSRLDFGTSLGGGFTSSYFGLHGNASIYYHYVKNLKGGLNIYGGFGIRHYFSRVNSPEFNYLNVSGVGGEFGLEYDFNAHAVPLLLGISYRPTLNYHYINEAFHITNGPSLSLRYTF